MYAQNGRAAAVVELGQRRDDQALVGRRSGALRPLLLSRQTCHASNVIERRNVHGRRDGGRAQQALLLRETMGVNAETTTRAFRESDVEHLLSRAYVPVPRVQYVFTAVDPAGGGASAFAVCTIALTSVGDVMVRVLHRAFLPRVMPLPHPLPEGPPPSPEEGTCAEYRSHPTFVGALHSRVQTLVDAGTCDRGATGT